MKFNRRGQVTAEMAVLFTFVIAGFVFMGIYLQRAAQGGVKSNADSLGQQFSTQSQWASYSKQQSKTNTANLSRTAQCNEYKASVAAAGPGPVVAAINACTQTMPLVPTG